MQDNVSERMTDEKKNLVDLSESLVQIGFRSQNVAIDIEQNEFYCNEKLNRRWGNVSLEEERN